MEMLEVKTAGNARLGSYDHLRLLTPREKQILEKLCDGISNEEIAASLNIRLHTVKFHLKKIYSIFDANKRHVVIIEALKTGAVRPRWIDEINLN